MMTCEYLLLDRHEINLSTFQLNGNILINNLSNVFIFI